MKTKSLFSLLFVFWRKSMKMSNALSWFLQLNSLLMFCNIPFLTTSIRYCPLSNTCLQSWRLETFLLLASLDCWSAVCFHPISYRSFSHNCLRRICQHQLYPVSHIEYASILNQEVQCGCSGFQVQLGHGRALKVSPWMSTCKTPTDRKWKTINFKYPDLSY